MSATTVKIPNQFKILDQSIRELSENHSFEQAQKVIDHVVSLLGIDTAGRWKPFNDSQGKIRSNASWFMIAEGFADKRATYKLSDNNEQNIDLKCYWMKKLNKSIISWLVALTPNFEDEPFYGSLNVGIDFVIPEHADRVFVVLSKNYIVRTVELQNFLSVTQQEIFSSWITRFDFDNKNQIHDTLWKSFDLEPVNKSFYKGISAFFVELKQYLSEDKNVFDIKHAAYFTNRLIGRIVFCWFLNKKGIINSEIKYFEIGKSVSNEYYREKLETLFFKVFNTPIEERDIGIDDKTPFLNGGLFEIKENDKFNDLTLSFPKDYFDRFYQFLHHYNFTTNESTSVFQQVAIDPEMLGRIFENLLAEQAEETGEQARKAKGAFYTPREIVDYMCRESLREYLKSKFHSDDSSDKCISLLLDVKPHEYRDQQRNYRSELKPYKYEILKALDEITIIDPACGSGAFPIGMLHLLLDVYERLDATFDAYKKKIEIIKNNIFGVDIEPMAVEICRLRAWLSIIVDEDADSSKIEPLPNLDFKFICANSLVPLKQESEKHLFDTVEKDELIEIREKYFNARTRQSKEKLRNKYEQKINLRGTGNLLSSDRELQLKTYHPFDSENVASFFDADFMYGIKNGFCIVIGNPPYNQLSKNPSASKQYRQFLKEYYNTSGGRLNTFIFFIHLGFNLLSKEGWLTFIIPNTFLTQDYYSYTREFILENALLKSLVTYPYMPFENAVVENVTFLLQKKCASEYSTLIYSHDKKGIVEILRKDKKDFMGDKNKAFNVNPNNLVDEIYKIDHDELNQLCNINQAIALKGDKSLSLRNKNQNNEYVKLLDGRNIQKYEIHWDGVFLDYDVKRIHSCKKKDIFEAEEKLLFRRVSSSLIFAYDDKQHYALNTLVVLTPKNGSNISLKYLLGLMNSKMMNYIYKNKFKSTKKVFSEIQARSVGRLPIVKASDQHKQDLITLVDKILTSKKNNPGGDVVQYEKKIDDIVFDLYQIPAEKKELILSST